MDGNLDVLLSGMVRTSVCTTLAALAVLLLLPILGVRSPRIHQTTWILVILQGWILIPLTFTVPASSTMLPQSISNNAIFVSESLPTIHSSAIRQNVKPSNLQRYGKPSAIVVWLLGSLAVLGFYIKRYYSLATHVPIGSAPQSEEWKNEWREASGTISPQINVHFRVTDRAGPMLCFVPFVYLVLVPRLLWASLRRDDRVAILRHELAHLKHGDLWKNLAIRIFALPQWFNPLVWLAIRRFEEAGEWACDEEALFSSSLANTGYANTLLRVAGFSANAPCGAVAASAGVLTRRVARLLSSSDKEVSKMKSFAVPLLLLSITLGQAIRIESVQADKPVKLTAEESRAEAVARWHTEPYRIEPPDVLSIGLTWEDFNAEIESGGRLKAAKLHLNRREFLVGPDGNVSVHGFAKIFVAGMTLQEVREAIGDKLSERFGTPEVYVDIAQSNSKAIYVIEKRNGGDYVNRVSHPGPGHLTVLDALANQPIAFNDIDQAYVVVANSLADRLEVNLDALVSLENDKANFELLPGDRVFVVSDTAAVEDHSPSPPPPPAANRPSSYYSEIESVKTKRSRKNE